MLDEDTWDGLGTGMQDDILAMTGDITMDFATGTTCPDGSSGTCDVIELDLVFDETSLQDIFPNAWDDCTTVQNLPITAIRVMEGSCE